MKLIFLVYLATAYRTMTINFCLLWFGLKCVVLSICYAKVPISRIVYHKTISKFIWNLAPFTDFLETIFQSQRPILNHLLLGLLNLSEIRTLARLDTTWYFMTTIIVLHIIRTLHFLLLSDKTIIPGI